MSRCSRGLVVSCCYPQSTFALEAPENDGLFYEYMLRRFGFSEVRRLSDRRLGLESSHRGNVLRMVQWLVDGASAGDRLAFVFSGHGLSTTCTSAGRRDELDRALMASDLEDGFPTNLIFDSEFQAVFSTLPSGVLLTCIVDAPCGDTVLRLPWFYDAKSASFSGPHRARHSSLWPGDRHRRRGIDSNGMPDFVLRGAPPCAAKAGAARPSARGAVSRELFPGVAAFLICACRPDHVCIEASLQQGQPYGLLTSSLAAVLQQTLLQGGVAVTADSAGDHPQIVPRDTEAGSAKCPLTYLQLARAVDADLQKRLGRVAADRAGLEQHLLLGCSHDPSSCCFLEPPSEAPSIPRSVQPSSSLSPAILASLASGSGGEARWPNVLVQVCRVGPEGLARIACSEEQGGPLGNMNGELEQAALELLSSEVVGEFWLPPIAYIFPEVALPGDPAPPASQSLPRAPKSRRSPAVGAKSPRRGSSQIRPGKAIASQDFSLMRRELWCRMRTPAFGTNDQCYTWGAASRRDRLLPAGYSGSSVEAIHCENCGAAYTESGRFCSNCGNYRGLNPQAAASDLGSRLLEGAVGNPDFPLAAAAHKLRQGARGTGTMTEREFELFGVRELGLDLISAREVFASAMEHSSDGLFGDKCSASALAEALESLSSKDCQRHADPDHVLEARLELEWRSTVGLGPSAAAGEIRLFAAELRPRQLPKDTLLAQMNAREAELGFGGAVASMSMVASNQKRVSGGGRPRSAGRSGQSSFFPSVSVGAPLLRKSHDGGSALFLRFGLCASRDVYPEVAQVTPRGMLATPRLQAPEASWIVPHVVFVSPALQHGRLPATGEHFAQMPSPVTSAGESVPVCTCSRLVDVQRAALALPRSPPSSRMPAPGSAAKPYVAVPPLPRNLQALKRTGSDTTLLYPQE